MANAMLAYNNRASAATLSGGSYLSALPLNNLKTRTIKEVCRTSNLALASTKFVIDLGPDKPVRMLALVNHNMSLTAKYRVRAGADPTFATYDYDSGWLDVWPPVYTTYSLEWQALNWFWGRYLEEERTGYTWNVSHILPAVSNYRYFQIELDDTLRTDLTYIDIGRLFIAEAWQPVVNIANGAAVGWETKTEVQEALSGAEFFQRRPPFRVAQFVTDFMMDDEAFSRAFDIMRRMGIDQEVYYIYDPNDGPQGLRRQFMGRLRKLSPIEITNFLLRKAQWEVKELL